MKELLFLVFSVAFCGLTFAQTTVSGRVTDESNFPVNNVIVVDLSTDEKVQTNANGEFQINVMPNSVLRFVAKFLKRQDVSLKSVDKTKVLSVVLEPEPIAIAPVIIGFKPSLNIKKDAKALDESVKLSSLKNGLNNYMRGPMTEVVPKSSVPSGMDGLDYKAGTVDLLKVAGVISKLFKKRGEGSKTKANYAEKERFKNRMLQSIDMQFLKEYGMDDYDIELFLSVADDRLQLSKDYRNNFNPSAVEIKLKTFLNDYLKTTKINRKR